MQKRTSEYFKHVLFVAPNYKNRKGGIASVLFQYSKYIENFNFFPSVLYQNKVLNAIIFPSTCVVFCWFLIFNPNYKVVHIHGSSNGSFFRKYLLFIICKLNKRKVVYHIHGSEYHLFYDGTKGFVKRWVKSMINRVDVLVVLSKEWKSYFKKNFQQPNIRIVNNIVAFKDPAVKSDPKSPLSLIFLGRIGERKGIWDLIEVISKNKDHYIGKLKLIVGGDGEVKKLKELITINRIDGLVNYIGWVSGEEKKMVLSKGDILILPSYNEGLPISLLEGMSYSMPLIASNVGGIPQILVDGENGFSFNPGDLNTIEKALDYYITSPREVLIHGSESYKKVLSFFPQNVMSSLEKIYKSLIQP